MNKFAQIEAFLAIVHSNSFAAAARKLGISTAAVSRQISQLEKELGTQLLFRTTRQISLTEIGEQYYIHCKKALEELDQGHALITGKKAEPTGTLYILSNRPFANEYLIPYLSEFISRYPKLILKLELAERFPDFNEENVDILFGVSLEGPPELVRKRITTTRYVLCASKEYFKKYGKPKTPDDLIHYHYITHSMRQPNNIIQLREEKKICVNPILYLNDSQSMIECALHGVGIVLLHKHIVRDAINSGKLIEIFSEYQEREKPVYLYYQHQQYIQPKIRHCIDFFTKKNKFDF